MNQKTKNPENILPQTPLYLSTGLMNCVSSPVAFLLAKGGLLTWNPELEEKAAELIQRIKNLENQEKLQKEIAKETLNKYVKLVEGLHLYNQQSFKLERKKTPVLWQEGSSTLLDYGLDKNNSAPIMLFIPSLINKSYILDLSEKRSLILYLSQQKINCALLDWGEPGENEKSFGLEEYVCRINKVIRKLASEYRRKIILCGYCMGGLMAMAAALQQRENICGLVLLATPWNFHYAENETSFFRHNTIRSLVRSWQDSGKVSGRMIYQMFYFIDPWAVNQKYEIFADLDPDSEEAKSFMEREQWLHDDVAITSHVAEDCFIGWAVENLTYRKRWKIMGKIVNPEEINMPTLIAIPRNDIIVPPLSSMPLSALIERAQTIFSPAGHVSMIVGHNAKQYLWLKLAKWVHNL